MNEKMIPTPKPGPGRYRPMAKHLPPLSIVEDSDDTDGGTEELTVKCDECGAQYSDVAEYRNELVKWPIDGLLCPNCRPTTEEK